MSSNPTFVNNKSALVNGNLKCSQCSPYNQTTRYSGEPSFCKSCGSLLSVSKSPSVKPIRYTRSGTFDGPQIAINPTLMLEQMLTRQKVLTPKEGVPAFCNYRHQIIDFLEGLCRQQDLKITTFVLAIKLLDEICTKMDFKRDELMLISLNCLSIASKMEEHCQKIPLALLCQYLRDKFSVGKIIEAENIIFGLLDFNAKREIPIEFLYFFLSRGVIKESELDSLSEEQQTALLKHFEQLAIKLTIYLSKDYSFNFVAPSQAAAAVIMCCRRAFGFDAWTDELTAMTGCSLQTFNQISNYVQKIFAKLDVEKIQPIIQKEKRQMMSNTYGSPSSVQTCSCENLYETSPSPLCATEAKRSPFEHITMETQAEFEDSVL